MLDCILNNRCLRIYVVVSQFMAGANLRMIVPDTHREAKIKNLVYLEIFNEEKD